MSRIVLMLFTYISITSTQPIPSNMKKLMNHIADPCRDFYRYSCRGWDDKIHDEETWIDTSTKVIDAHIDHIVQDIIHEKPLVISEFWKSCMATEQLKTLDNKPLQEDLNRITKAETKVQLMELAGEFARTDGNVFVKFKLVPDPSNSQINTLLVQSILTLPHHHYYFDVDIRKEYGKYISQVMRLGISKYKRKRDQKLDLYDEYAKIVIWIEDHLLKLEDHSFDPIKMGMAMKSWPMIFDTYKKGMRVQNIKEDLTIYGSYEYLQKVETFIENGLTLQQLQVYIMFRMIHSRVEWLNENFDMAFYLLFRFSIKGQVAHRSRKRICRDRLRKYLPDLVGTRFYSKSFDHDKKTKVLEIIKWIRVAMEESINRATWLDGDAMNVDEGIGGSSTYNKKTKKEIAIDKLNKLSFLIGQSKAPKSCPSSLSPNDFPQNMYKILSHSFDEDMMKVGQTRDQDEWPVSSMDINAHYIPYQNAIVLPAGVLQPPLLYGGDVHPARNFGAIGAIIGHEMIHAFDVKGSFYNAEGNRFPWWDVTKTEAYTDGAQCFEKQYSELLNVNGILTLNENIADNGGLKLAWAAYRKYITTVKPDTNGVDQDDGDRLFFLSFSQMWCERAREKVRKDHYVSNERSPGIARVNGVVMNSMHFAKAFGCKLQSRMNPEKKCALW